VNRPNRNATDKQQFNTAAARRMENEKQGEADRQRDRQKERLAGRRRARELQCKVTGILCCALHDCYRFADRHLADDKQQTRWPNLRVAM